MKLNFIALNTPLYIVKGATMLIYLTRSLEKYKAVVPPGTEQIAASMLLLHFAGDSITESQMEGLSSAIPSMKGIFWQHKFVPASKVDETCKISASQLLKTSDKQLVKSIVEFNNTSVDRKFHLKFSTFRIHWIEHEQCVEVAHAYEGSPHLAGRAIALIPYNDEAAWQWGSLTYGLASYSLWYLSRPRPAANPEQWIFLIDEFLLNYLKLTVHIGGIPSLPFKDINAQAGLVFFGPFELLEQVYTKLQQVASIYSNEEFDKYYRRYGPDLDHWRVRV